MNDTPLLNVIGELVALGPDSRELTPVIERWLNDFAVMAPLGAPLHPVPREAATALYEQANAAQDQVWFVVYERVTMRPIGISGLRDIDHAHGRAEFVIWLGEKDCWGKGYGTETTRLLLNYGFSALSLHTIMLRVYSFNERGIRAYRRAGFREIGRWREAHRLAGSAHDIIFMDCLAADFLNDESESQLMNNPIFQRRVDAARKSLRAGQGIRIEGIEE
ncbi:MAG: GNAT family N-acetyltransferase [Dehalococcoidia bacterium]